MFSFSFAFVLSPANKMRSIFCYNVRHHRYVEKWAPNSCLLDVWSMPLTRHKIHHLCNVNGFPLDGNGWIVGTLCFLSLLRKKAMKMFSHKISWCQKPRKKSLDPNKETNTQNIIAGPFNSCSYKETKTPDFLNRAVGDPKQTVRLRSRLDWQH